MDKFTSTEVEDIIVVEFKETYMPHSVKRACIGMTRDEVIAQYGLEEDDIEWYKFID